MQKCDVIVVGGGPAGSTCAWRLVRAGLDVVVIDRADFPRHKPCAGWVTVQAFETLRLPREDYAAEATLQPLIAFRTSMIGGPAVTTRYPRPVSYAVRRSEFDWFLLARSGARLCVGQPVRSVTRTAGGEWVVNDTFAAPVLVGAGGHFCPVARTLAPGTHPEPVIAAREVEFLMDASQQSACPVRGDTAEIYLSRDLTGYGWLVRKGNYLNVGFGQVGNGGLGANLESFAAWTRQVGRLPPDTPSSWPGHAYLMWETTPRQPVGDGVLLVGDALGLAAARSGEGIRPAIDSGLLAAETILDAGGLYTRERLEGYAARLKERFGPRARPARMQSALPGLRRSAARTLMRSAWFTRRYFLDRWFLQRHVPSL